MFSCGEVVFLFLKNTEVEKPVLLRRSWLEDSSALKTEVAYASLLRDSWPVFFLMRFPLAKFPSSNMNTDKYEFRFVCETYNPPKELSKIVASKFAAQKVN